jgi:hypothetical protein
MQPNDEGDGRIIRALIQLTIKKNQNEIKTIHSN